MGKRKKSSRTPQGPKKREPLATQFQCLFCNHEKSVTVKLHKKESIGELSCRVCGQTYQTSIHWLSAAVDVYSDWIDACEAVATGENADTSGVAMRETYREVDVSRRAGRLGAGRGGTDGPANQQEDDLDGFIENDDIEGEAAYADE